MGYSHTRKKLEQLFGNCFGFRLERNSISQTYTFQHFQNSLHLLFTIYFKRKFLYFVNIYPFRVMIEIPSVEKGLGTGQHFKKNYRRSTPQN